MEIIIAIILGFLLDLLFGDPDWLPHPIVFIGKMISKGEKWLRRVLPDRPFIGGMVLTILVTLVSFVIPYFILFLLGLWSVYARIVVETWFCYQILATKSLKKAGLRVYYQLEKNNLDMARKYLSWIVGRDTGSLDSDHVCRAVVETVAENTSDGVIAPMFFMLIGGAPLGFFYKAVNTLDSMIGYKNEQYILFGRFAAKLDDVMNFIPAILSAWLMIAAAYFRELDYKAALRIYKRDRKNHASPNSARTESVAAGALGIQLAGDAYYFGKLVSKPTIGDPTRPIHFNDIKLINDLMYMTALLGLLVTVLLRLVFVLIF